MLKFSNLVACIALLAVISTGAQAQTEEKVRIVTDVDGVTTVVVPDSQKPDEGQAALARALVAASHQSGMDAFWDGVHPAVRGCLNDEDRAISELMNFKRMTEKPVPDVYAVQVQPVDAGKIKVMFDMLYGAGAEMPVQPTHSLTLHYGSKTGVCPAVQTSKALYIAQDKGRWYEVMACNGKRTLGLAEIEQKRMEQDAMAEKVIAKVSAEKRSEIQAALQGGDKPAALKILGEAAGIGMQDAYGVIERFCAP